jgi:hypothetical protein
MWTQPPGRSSSRPWLLLPEPRRGIVRIAAFECIVLRENRAQRARRPRAPSFDAIRAMLIKYPEKPI